MQLLGSPVATAGVIDEGIEDNIQISYSQMPTVENDIQYLME